MQETAERTWSALIRARSVEALRRSEDRLLKALSIETVGVLFFDLAGRVLAHLPALALTAYARDEDRDRALAEGFSAYLAKPVDPRKLIEMTCSIIAPQPPSLGGSEARDVAS